MKLHVRGTTYRGRVVDLRHRPVDGRALAAAVSEQCLTPAVDAPTAPSVHDYCGHVHPELGLRIRTALAAAARSRGRTTSHDETLAELRERVAALDTAEPSLPPARDGVAEGRIAELRESVAAQRGRLEARARLDAETAAAEREVREATSELAQRETERTAAEESRRQRREAAREYRDRLAKRRRLADRLANRRRDARAELVAAVGDEFEAALAACPGPTPDDPFDASPVTAALAVLRVAATDAPVVLGVDRFGTPTAAADWLDAPVVRC